MIVSRKTRRIVDRLAIERDRHAVEDDRRLQRGVVVCDQVGVGGLHPVVIDANRDAGAVVVVPDLLDVDVDAGVLPTTCPVFLRYHCRGNSGSFGVMQPSSISRASRSRRPCRSSYGVSASKA